MTPTIKSWRFGLSHMLDSFFEAGFVHSILTIIKRIVITLSPALQQNAHPC